MDAFSIDPKSPVPVWAQTKNRLVYLILSGHYKEGEKLPTVRDLAAELKINYNTVNKAYQALERDGFVATVRGKGAFVTDKAARGFFVMDNDVDFLIQELIEKSLDAGMTGQELAMRVLSTLRKGGFISEQATAEVIQLTRSA